LSIRRSTSRNELQQRTTSAYGVPFSNREIEREKEEREEENEHLKERVRYLENEIGRLRGTIVIDLL
jgi:hypothetical protein